MWQSGSEISSDVDVIRQKRGPVYVEWHIKNYFSYTEENKCLKSPKFYLSDDTEWWLRLHPASSGGMENSDHIAFYLCKGISEEKYDINYKLGILKPNDSVFKAVERSHVFKEKDSGFGLRTFLLRSDLVKSKDTIVIDGVLRVFCLIRFVDKTVKETACGTCSPKSVEILTQNFQDLYLDRRLSDVTVTVKNTDFHAHKCILASRSPVFAPMFEHDMVEKRSSTVTITDCDPDSFEKFLLFLYTGNLENVLPSNVFSLYETAHKYDVKELKEECLQIMEHTMSVDTFSDAVIVAVNYKESELLNSATEFFIKNVENIIPTVKWQLFMGGNPCLANELLMKLFKVKPVTKKK